MHKLEESKVERQMLDNNEDNEGQNEQGLDEEDEEPRSSRNLSAQTSYPEVKRNTADNAPQYPPVELKSQRYPNPSTTMGSMPSSQPLSLK